MKRNQIQYLAIKGMNRDLSISKSTNEFSYENKNIRITVNNGDTLFTITNERGTKQVYPSKLDLGTILGYCSVKDYVVIFSKKDSSSSTDGSKITILKYDSSKPLEESFSLFKSIPLSLGFNLNNPIESLGVYEAEDIIKVYWVDGINQPRVINILSPKLDNIDTSDSTIFNFSPAVYSDTIKERFNITKEYSSGGTFQSGTIQYHFSYFNLYGQETSIIYSSPVYYLSFKDRGGSPEERVNNIFNITIDNPSNKFDYIRIYSTRKTSENGDIVANIVRDIKISSNSSISIVDNGLYTESIDPTRLLYIGGDNIIASTLTSKDNTLFLGNIKDNTAIINKELRDKIRTSTVKFINVNTGNQNPNEADFQNYLNKVNLGSFVGTYPYTINLDKPSNEIKTFKYGDYYRIGVQFLSKEGIWSDPVYIGDFKNDVPIYFPNSNDIPNNSDNFVYLPQLKIKLPNDVINELRVLNYIRVRPVVVYPNDSERSFVCQGVVSPTVYSTEDRMDNSPFVQSSWFFRPSYIFNTIQRPKSYEDTWRGNTVIEFRHNKSLFGDLDNGSVPRGVELPTQFSAPEDPIVDKQNASLWRSNNNKYFFVDSSILTMHSPDLEFNGLSSNEGLKFKIVGLVPIQARQASLDVKTSTSNRIVKIDENSTKQGMGLYLENLNKQLQESANANGTIVSEFCWEDYFLDKVDHNIVVANSLWLIHPWHGGGSISHTIEDDTIVSSSGSSVLKSNRRVNYHYSYNSLYLQNPWEAEVSNNVNRPGITSIAYHNSNEERFYNIRNNKNKNIIYQGNVDKLVTCSNKLINEYEGYATSAAYINKGTLHRDIHSAYTASFGGDRAFKSNPVSLKYKSTPHAVFGFNIGGSNNDTQITLPIIADREESIYIPDSKMLFWDNDRTISSIYSEGLSNPFYNIITANAPFLFLGELYRDVDVNSLFGGNTESAISNNQWYVCGEVVGLNEDIIGTEGDIYYQRYDCIKTYPFTLEDENSVTEILSFMCETKINIDGRYDKNRGSLNASVTPENFNQINNVYSDDNRFQTYRSLDSTLFNTSNYPTTIIWSLPHKSKSHIDSWTSISQASSHILDGVYGDITSLNFWNNEIFAFQEHGFSNIMYNSRTQIPTSDGVPIEITNSGNVLSRYLSRSMGCTNKWSIVESPNGIYFIDNNSSSINLYNGNIASLSDNLGFRQWINDNNINKPYNPIDFENFIGYYDRSNNDVYFVNKNSSLCYSELLGQFTSFFDYNNVSAMFNLQNKFLSINKDTIWEHSVGEYNNFYGEIKPFHIIFKCNPNEPTDKIFSNIEFRSDTWSINPEQVLLNKSFDTLEVWNEYQYGKSTLEFKQNNISTLKRKFRIWRANIPRDNNDKRGINRIRNPWSFIKLSMENPNNYKTAFHDLIVYYYE